MRRLAVIGAAIVAIDRITKIVVRGAMIYGESVKIFDFFRITYVENTGSAWGFFAGGQYSNYVFLAVNLAALAYLMFNYGKFAVDKYSSLAWALVTAGALGNIGDRLFVGAVVDFFDVRIFGYNFPVFNIADSSLTVGGFLLAFSLIKNTTVFRRAEQQR